MFLFHSILPSNLFDEISRKNKEAIVLKNGENSFTIIGKNKKIINNFRHEISLTRSNNIFDNLWDDSISISPIKLELNNENFQVAYTVAKQIFKKELLTDLDTQIINLYNYNIIKLPPDVLVPTRFDKKYQKRIPIKFRKDVFLQTYAFIQELNKELDQKHVKMSFERVYKYVWKKTVTPLENQGSLQGHNI